MRPFWPALAAAITLACGGGPQPDSGGASRAPSSDDWFVDRAAETGLVFTYFNGMSGQYYFPEMLPGGVALFDYDNDGDLDVYFAQGRMLPADRPLGEATVPPAKDALPLTGRLFRNDLQAGGGPSTLRFTDVTAASGVEAAGYGMGAAAADVDNDGCIDLYLTNLGANQLFHNNCDGTFSDVSAKSGANDPGWSVSASFADYDRDGWLDLYVGNYVEWDLKTDKKCTGLTGRRDYCTPKVYVPQPDRLYHNRGNGTFEDVTAKALAGGRWGPALGIVTADFDRDGWMDIYVANDGAENLLWMNQRNGTFRNQALLAGAALTGDGKAEASMGVDAGDFDNDGDDDLFMTELPSEGNNLYVNNGAGMFEDLSARSGLGPLSLGHSGFGTAWFDYDNDGWLDVLAVNGAIEAVKGRPPDARFPYDERKLLFHNLRDGRFEEVSGRAGAVFAASEVSRGAAFGDIDNDGDIDVVISNIHSPARLLINQAADRRHWLGLRLIGRDGRGRDMLGARVDVTRGDGVTLYRRSRTDGSYASANDPRVLIGLGDATAVSRIRITWPDGTAEERPGAAIDRWTTIRQGGDGR
jgi:enediyne biosynthesis protein E4